MRTQPVLDQTALRTVRSLIGYGCGKEAKPASGHADGCCLGRIYSVQAPRYDPKTKVGSIAIGSRIQLDCLRANESGSRAFWLYH
jgi:hypothetical protein